MTHQIVELELVVGHFFTSELFELKLTDTLVHGVVVHFSIHVVLHFSVHL